MPDERAGEMGLVTGESMRSICDHSPVAWTLRRDSRVLASAGIVAAQSHIGAAWAFVDRKVEIEDMRVGVEIIRGVIDDAFLDPRVQRIETNVSVDFKAGHKWATILGFEREGLMRRYDPSGNDHWLYAKVRED